MHLNPALGISELLACNHLDILRQLALYCVGPVVGVILALKLMVSISTNCCCKRVSSCSVRSTTCCKPCPSDCQAPLCDLPHKFTCGRPTKCNNQRGTCNGQGGGKYIMVKMTKGANNICEGNSNKGPCLDACDRCRDTYRIPSYCNDPRYQCDPQPKQSPPAPPLPAPPPPAPRPAPLPSPPPHIPRASLTPSHKVHSKTHHQQPAGLPPGMLEETHNRFISKI